MVWSPDYARWGTRHIGIKTHPTSTQPLQVTNYETHFLPGNYGVPARQDTHAQRLGEKHERKQIVRAEARRQSTRKCVNTLPTSERRHWRLVGEAPDKRTAYI